MILISSIPKDRANLSIDAMKAGKDVMVDKPGCTTPVSYTHLTLPTKA